MPDLELKCVQCQNIFLFSEKDQDTFYRRNLPQPQRCPVCRPTRKKMAVMANGDAEKAARHDIICDRCGKADTVSFPPKPGRAVLCGYCYAANKTRNRYA